EIDLFVSLVQIGVIGGAIILAGEFHLRMLVSLTRMREYLIALIAGFLLALGYVFWVTHVEGGIYLFSLTLLIGSLGMSFFALLFAPKTESFWKNNSLAFLGALLAAGAAVPFDGLSVRSILIQGVVISTVYVAWSWSVGLFGWEDLRRVLPGARKTKLEGGV
ncbi:MAG: hypothetical protein KC931_23940, partial [Candidatus Omnitrophica bacterium]|nr:hypothetical protein [Candidatus Omnitrophota bacterium]